MTTIYDIHTHSTSCACHAIISVSPAEYAPLPQQYYSVGIHPWDSMHATAAGVEKLQQTAQHAQVVAIGECGIDTLRGGDASHQIALLKQHIITSEELQKPLILHIVKSTDKLLALHKELHPRQQWIMHGFRGNATTAQQLLDKGIQLSFGAKYNRETLLLTPLEQMWVESDEESNNIEEIYCRIASDKGIEIEELKNTMRYRAEKLFLGL